MTLEVEFLASLDDIEAARWDALWPASYPFTQHRFLYALETTSCTGAGSGWQARHLIIRDDEEIVAGAPLFVKSHSYGEYVFDWSWAGAYESHGLDYYPKLLNAIPFTPATGPRWGCVDAAEDKRTLWYRALSDALAEQLRTTNLSSAHCLFPNTQTRKTLESLPNWQERWDYQYHWLNKDYQDFADFLQQLTSRKRKNINKERQKISTQGIRVEVTLGCELSEQDWQDFYLLYRETYIKRSGHLGYLTEAFFIEIGRSMADQIMMVRAFHADQLCAAALYFFDQQTLYGRYWGCVQEYDALHFECCYYQGIEFAIEQKLQRFDPGAQGQHKIGRGFQPLLTCSFHHIKHPQFAEAIGDFLEREKQQLQLNGPALREQLPFKDDYELFDETLLL